MTLPAGAVNNYNLVRECGDKKSICHAPSYSMYFGRDGLVSACCYSRLNPLGTYPENSISQIWFGSAIAELRGHLGRNLLPNGCDICADQLIAGNYNGLLAAQFDSLARPRAETLGQRMKSLLRTGRRSVYPTRLEFELSNKCNLECSMCSGFFSSSIRSNRDKLPALPQVYDANFVTQLREFVPHLKEAKFLGGEPFLVDLYYEIWELFIELNPACRIAVTTNATVYTEKVKRVLEKLNCEIVVSLDSVDKEVYEGIRRNAVFSRTMENLSTFTAINRRKGKVPALAVCPMISNWQGLPDLMSFANSRNMTVYCNTVTHPHHMSLRWLPPGELTGIVTFLRQSLRNPAHPIEAHNNLVIEDLCRQVEFWIDTDQKKSDPLRLKCRLYLKRFDREESGPFHSLLSILALDRFSEEMAAAAFPISGLNEIRQTLSDYIGAIWKLGAMLAADGLLEGARYQETDLREFLAFLESRFPPAKLLAIYAKAVRLPLEVMQLAGTRSAQELIDVAVDYFSSQNGPEFNVIQPARRAAISQ